MNSKVNLDVRELSTKVAIVGGGFGGLCMAIKLREAGIEDFVVLEKAAEVGGTWRDNTYPGAACDVQSHLYSYSFEGNPDWSRRYSGWREIQDYILRVTDKHRLHDNIRFNSEVEAAHFDEKRARWTLRLTDGTRVDCQHWVLATGPLHVPSIPEFPGLENFKGKVFHSSQWDHDYDLGGKKVVSVGTGASAIQYVPEIAPKVDQLTVVQRTPGWIVPRDERAYSQRDKNWFRRFPLLRKLHRARLYWSNESRVLPIFHPRLASLLEPLVKRFIRYQVKDKDTARKLTPNYRLGCKRIMISNRYYPTFNRPNVELVTEGVKEIREHSIVFSDGSEREMDCLVLGTGFVVDPRIYMKDFEITGLPGHRLQDDWRNASEAYLGVSVAGYPNMFQMVGPNTGLGHNWPAGAGSGGSYISANSIDYPAYVTEFFFDNNRRVDRSGEPTPTPTPTGTPTPTPTVTPSPTPTVPPSDCVTATNAAHKAAGRATSYGVNPYNPHYAIGTQDYLGLGDATVTSLQRISASSWDLVSSCS